MLIYNDTTIKNNIKENYVALGSFDGLHLGHLSLINKVCDLARENNGKSMVFTFKEHPRKMIKPDAKVQMLMSNEEKISLLEKNNVDILILKSFNKEFMELTPEEFIRFLCENYNVKGIVVGFNFKFGYKNLGDVKVLHKYAEKYNYELYVMDPYIYNEEIVSSTKIRSELLQGDVQKAFNMLSRPYSIYGEVVDGKKLGRTIGFPTANMKINFDKVIPAIGVYYTNVKINGKIFKGITSIGNNPTVNGKELTVETYILDFDENIYGKEITLYFIEKIRNEKKFNGIDELVKQLTKDKKYAEENQFILSQNVI